MAKPMLRVLARHIVSSVALMTALDARAADMECYGLPRLSDDPEIGLGHIEAGSARIYFVANGLQARGCPGPQDRCRAKAYLVPGDRVLLGRAEGAFVCAEFVSRKGLHRAGWLPAASVVEETPSPVGFADWIGTWSAVEATVTIARAEKPGMLSITGEATWGSLDPDRVRRGAVNIGSIEAVVSPQGASSSFAMGENGTLPVDKGGATDCKVWMRRLGPYLLVDDNNNCGGMNVSFTGSYIREMATEKQR